MNTSVLLQSPLVSQGTMGAQISPQAMVSAVRALPITSRMSQSLVASSQITTVAQVAPELLNGKRGYADLAFNEGAVYEGAGMALILHELTHLAGGSEADAEFVELLVGGPDARLPTQSDYPKITKGGKWVIFHRWEDGNGQQWDGLYDGSTMVKWPTPGFLATTGSTVMY